MEISRWTLSDATEVPLTPPQEIRSWGSVLVLAPHPDDEALGCGGLIVLLRSQQIPVTIVWLTDGRGSHPRSTRYPPPELIALRRKEAEESAAALGVSDWYFLDLEDTKIPQPPCEKTVGTLHRLLQGVNTVLTPWRLDPHCDHRDAFAYLRLAVQGLPVQIVEYPIWVWQKGTWEDHPPRAEFSLMRLDIGDFLPQKKRAVDAHRSQVTDLISDDPDGFRVPPDLLVHFLQPWELYLLPR